MGKNLGVNFGWWCSVSVNTCAVSLCLVDNKNVESDKRY